MDQPSTVQIAVDLIEEQLLEPFDVERVAAAVGLSPWHFQRVFRLLDLPAEKRRDGVEMAVIQRGLRMENVGLTYPDGRQEVLLDVPTYDFNWQTSFVLAEPKLIPKGTKMVCTAHFDNSDENLANPDPSATVRWGEQTWQEMLIGWHDVATPRKR